MTRPAASGQRAAGKEIMTATSSRTNGRSALRSTSATRTHGTHDAEAAGDGLARPPNASTVVRSPARPVARLNEDPRARRAGARPRPCWDHDRQVSADAAAVVEGDVIPSSRCRV